MSFTLQPTGIGDTDYLASGYLNLANREIVAFTRSGDTVTITARGQFTTTPVEHASGVSIQQCAYFDAVDPAEIIQTVLVDGAGVDAGAIPIDAWLTETEAHFRRLLTRLVPRPEGVRKLVSQVIQQAALAVWPDEQLQLVRLQVLRSIPTDAERFTPANIRPGSLSIKEQPEKRISQVWVHYGQINPALSTDEPSNYRVSERVIDTDAEDDYGVPVIRYSPRGSRSAGPRSRSGPREYSSQPVPRPAPALRLRSAARYNGASPAKARAAAFRHQGPAGSDRRSRRCADPDHPASAHAWALDGDRGGKPVLLRGRGGSGQPGHHHQRRHQAT